MCTFSPIPDWVSGYVVVLSAVGGLVAYLIDKYRDREARRVELTWNKTQVILKLAENFSNDKQCQNALRIIQFKEESLKKLLGDKKSLTPLEIQDRLAVDRFLDFFDYLYHIVFKTKALEPIDFQCFLWYLRIIKDTPELKKYVDVEENGFKDVLILYNAIQEATDKE